MHARRRLLTAYLGLGALAVAPAPALRAQAGLLVPTSTGRPDPAVLSLREMEVAVGIARGYARINVRQVFENHTPAIQEGSYRFALPPGAAVGDFAIWDGLQRIPAVILEKKRARSLYQELARKAIDPGLLQQGEEEDAPAGPGGAGPRSAGALFSVTVAPIPPLATKRLELQFQQEVPIIGGRGEFRLVLRPPDAEPAVAGRLTVRVSLAGSAFEAVPGALPLQPDGDGAGFSGEQVRLDRDLVLRLRPKNQEPLRLSAFRNPLGTLPDGLALAPWERPAELPPEQDGFFLLEALPPGPARPAPAAAPVRTGSGLDLAILFDTSLGHRWAGLETAYGHLTRVLQALGGGDRFALIPFDRAPGAAVLRPGADLVQALAAARKLLGGQGRILLLGPGRGALRAPALREAAGPLPLFTAVTVGEAGTGLAAASSQLLGPTATELDADLFFQRLLGPGSGAGRPKAGLPFAVGGGEPRLRDIYPVLVQPPEPGSLSGWVGRYGAPAPGLHWEGDRSLGGARLQAGLPEQALEARDLPRRWARARVDDLLRRLDADGERREWIDEIIALSRRYKFVTPYTAFLAAPRALLRPRRIQPGDPVLRVECDPATIAATALFPFGLKLDLVRRPASDLWEGRFLVPEGFPDGRHPVRILVTDASGARATETKHFILASKAPEIQPGLPASCRAGEQVRITAATGADVVFLTARVGSAPPIPLRWDPAAQRCAGLLRIPEGLQGPQEVFFEAVDAAKNRGFARATLEVRP